jgi:hypothetical protein
MPLFSFEFSQLPQIFFGIFGNYQSLLFKYCLCSVLLFFFIHIIHWKYIGNFPIVLWYSALFCQSFFSPAFSFCRLFFTLSQVQRLFSEHCLVNSWNHERYFYLCSTLLNLTHCISFFLEFLSICLLTLSISCFMLYSFPLRPRKY